MGNDFEDLFEEDDSITDINTDVLDNESSDDEEFDKLFNGDNSEGQSDTVNDTLDDVKPVKLGKKATGAILMLVLFFIAIIFLTVRAAKITKVTNNSTEVASSEIANPEGVTSEVQVYDESNSEFGQNTSENVGSESTLPESGNTTELEGSNATSEVVVLDNFDESTTEGKVETKNEESSDNSLVEVNDPALSEVVQAQGMVSGKKVYSIGTGYMYEIRVIMMVGENSIFCSYYCPRKTYDALSIGDSLMVDYQTDSSGNISVSSISKQ